jgi:DNA-binding HxlR family transcriptional regulator
MACPAARTLDVVGEWWTLLIIRDALRGARRFDDFKQTGISDNILAARLKRLAEAGIFERSRYQQRPDRYEYVLTAKGRALGPVVAALRDWGANWTEAPTGPRSPTVPAATRSPSGFIAPTATARSRAPRSAQSTTRSIPESAAPLADSGARAGPAAGKALTRRRQSRCTQRPRRPGAWR